jgi:hypothetical protein
MNEIYAEWTNYDIKVKVSYELYPISGWHFTNVEAS